MNETPDLASAQKILAAQPFSVLLGTRLAAFGGGEATLELDNREELRQQYGYVHGGVLAYVAENAMAFAAGTVPGNRPLTTGFTIDYVRPADGESVRARARVVRAGRSLAVCRCDLTSVGGDGSETLCAVAQGTISFAPGGGGEGDGA
ncbi:PaaI family thioesterase [Streptomyces sp. NPDC096040]|uniref:PaaI family thioesterase n=1 Tax=Streptomyces sp. NPDC096040 TaxID=3155541 RepID=UPI003332E847